jgi:hypothetical protein
VTWIVSQGSADIQRNTICAIGMTGNKAEGAEGKQYLQPALLSKSGAWSMNPGSVDTLEATP